MLFVVNSAEAQHLLECRLQSTTRTIIIIKRQHALVPVSERTLSEFGTHEELVTTMARLLLYTTVLLIFQAFAASARTVTITEHRSACSASSTAAWPSCAPTNAIDTCEYDAKRDRSAGTVDLSDPLVRELYYSTSSTQWLRDDMPYRGLVKLNHKRFSIDGVWDDVSTFVSNVRTRTRSSLN